LFCVNLRLLAVAVRIAVTERWPSGCYGAAVPENCALGAPRSLDGKNVRIDLLYELYFETRRDGRAVATAQPFLKIAPWARLGRWMEKT